MKISKPVFRIIDANFNRLREALRVCEDITRFFLEEPGFTKKIKILRQEVGLILKENPDFSKGLILSRDSSGDVGKATTFLESARCDIADIFYANIERAKESLRVLEELSKLVDTKMAERFKKLRFRLYKIEKALCDVRF